MSKILCSPSFALDSAHVKYGVWTWPQTPYFTWAESNANEGEQRIFLICIRFGSCEVRRLNLALVTSRCCFAEDGREMYQDSKRTCTAIVLLIKPFVWWRSRCRRRRGLLKLPNNWPVGDGILGVPLWLLYLSTQIRFPIGRERVTCRGSKLTNSQGKQQHGLSTRTRSGRAPWNRGTFVSQPE